MPLLFCLFLISGCIIGSPVPIDFLRPPKFDPSLRWQQLQTDHFYIYFHQGEEEASQEAARIAEEVHTLLTSRIGWTPSERTHLIISDQEDIANGRVLFFPHNTILMSLISGASHGEIMGKLKDWMRSVITHEYIHILQLDMHAQLPSLFRAIFGRYPFPLGLFNGPLPNDLQPFWLIEGLAVDQGEPDRSVGAYTEMLLRMAILENRFPTLDQAAGQLASWPGPEVHYLFGARFLEYIRKRFGDDALRKINKNYSGAPFPLWVDTNAKKTLGVSYLTLWEEWKAELTKQYHALETQVRAIGLTSIQPLTERGDQHFHPRIGPRGDIVYTHLNPYAFPALRVIKNSGEDLFVTRRNTAGTVSFSPDQSSLAFAQMEYWQNTALYSDLYLLDLESARVTRLTFGKRLRDPDFHPEGTRLVAVQGGGGKDRLVLYDLPTGLMEPIPEAEGLLMHQPRWSPDGSKIAVSGWREGYQDIYLLDRATRQMKPIRHDEALDVTPTWSPDGRYILFASDRTGIYNLFAYQIETDTLFQVTNLLGGAFMPEVGPSNTIVFSSYHARGFDLYTLPWNPTSWTPFPPNASSESLETLDTPALSPSVPGLKTEQAVGTALPKPYSPWPTLRPRYWVPIELAYDPQFGTTLGVSTGGMDVLGQHQFSVDLFLQNRKLFHHLQYRNDVFKPTLFLDHWSLGQELSTESVRAPLYGEGMAFGIRFNRILFQHRGSLSFGGIGFHARDSALSDARGVTVSGLWDSTQGYPFSISPEEGYVGGVRYSGFIENAIWGLPLHQYDLFLNRYDTLLRPNHVLATELFGNWTKEGALDWGPLSHVQNRLRRGGFASLQPPASLNRSGGQDRESQVVGGTVSYRFPLRNIERGFRTWPFFFHRMHSTLFFDIVRARNVWEGDLLQESLFEESVGAEGAMNMTVSYNIPVQGVVGIVKGIDSKEAVETYFRILAGF